MKRMNYYRLTASDVSKTLGISRRTVYQLAQRGEIAHYRFGRSIRFTAADILDYMNASRRNRR